MFNGQSTKDRQDVEAILKGNHEKDFRVDTFATLPGIQGKQFGHVVYSSLIQFKDLFDFLTVFGEVQRQMNGTKINKIKRYALTGIEDSRNMRFFPGITCTARGHVFYDDDKHKLAIDIKNSRLSINDGQHRFFGINDAINSIKFQIKKEKDPEEIEKLNHQLKELSEMVIPVTIFSNLSEAEEKQLFTDANNLAQRPSRSSTIRLSQTDLVSVMARELSEKNRYLKEYGVEQEKSSIHKKNPNTILLTTIYASIKLLNRHHFKTYQKPLTHDNYESYKTIANETFNEVFRMLPPDINTKGKYILDRSYPFKGIFRFIGDARSEGIEDKIIFKAIHDVQWENDIEYWKNHGAGISTKSKELVFGSSGNHGVVAVADLLRKLAEEEIEKKKQTD